MSSKKNPSCPGGHLTCLFVLGLGTADMFYFSVVLCMLETWNVAKNESLCIVPVGKRLFYPKKMSLYLLISYLPLHIDLAPYFTERVHMRLPGGISLRFYFLHPRDTHKVFNLYLSSYQRGRGVLPRLSLCKSNARPHFLLTRRGS